MTRNTSKNKIQYKFFAYGHPNITGTHKTTLEFTKDEEVSLNGDCIIGVKADFNLKDIKDFIKDSIKNNNKKITITIKTPDKKIQEKISAELNPSFNSNKEFVIRKTNFVSERTFAINSNKAAFDLDRRLINCLKEKEKKISVFIENKEK